MSFDTWKGRNIDQQDGAESGVWGELTYLDGGGAYMSVRGTGTLDEELPVMMLGYGFNLPADSNAEVIMVSLSSDVNQKVAIPTLGRDVQYQWAPGTGGIQHPQDPERRVEFNGEETFLRDGKFVLGSNREVTVEVDGSNVTITTAGDANVKTAGDANIVTDGDVSVSAAGKVNINSAGEMELQATGGLAVVGPTLTHNGVDIGKDHKHSGVISGGAISGVPV